MLRFVLITSLSLILITSSINHYSTTLQLPWWRWFSLGAALKAEVGDFVEHKVRIKAIRFPIAACEPVLRLASGVDFIISRIYVNVKSNVILWIPFIILSFFIFNLSLIVSLAVLIITFLHFYFIIILLNKIIILQDHVTKQTQCLLTTFCLSVLMNNRNQLVLDTKEITRRNFVSGVG